MWFTVDYNNKIIFLPLMKKPFEMAYINFLYSGFTLLPLKAKFNLTIARAFLIFYFFFRTVQWLYHHQNNNSQSIFAGTKSSFNNGLLTISIWSLADCLLTQKNKKLLTRACQPLYRLWVTHVDDYDGVKNYSVVSFDASQHSFPFWGSAYMMMMSSLTSIYSFFALFFSHMPWFSHCLWRISQQLLNFFSFQV